MLYLFIVGSFSGGGVGGGCDFSWWGGGSKGVRGRERERDLGFFGGGVFMVECLMLMGMECVCVKFESGCVCDEGVVCECCYGC